MADCRYIAVFPRTGWWKDRPQFGHGERSVHFSLIVALEVPETATVHGVPVDLYTPVQQEITTKMPLTVPIPIMTTVPVGSR